MCPQYRMWKPSRLPGTCLAQPARASCLTAAILNPSLSPQRYRDDVSIVVTPLTTRTAKQQCARSRACVEALGRVIIWPGLQRGSDWCIGWRADSFLQGTRSRETGPVSACILFSNWLETFVFCGFPDTVSLGVTAVSMTQ